MKFSIENSLLLKAVNTVSRAISTKTTMSVLDLIYIKAKEGMLEIMGSDSEITIITSVPANVYRTGEILAPFRTLSDLIRTYRDETVEFEADEKNVLSIKCAQSVVTVLSRNAEDYPDIKVYPFEGYKINKENFIDMVKTTVFACAPQININPVLMGINVEYALDKICFTALDGYKLAQRTSPAAQTIQKPLNAIVPAKGMNEIVRVLSGSEKDAYFNVEDKRFIVSVGKTQVIVNLLEGTFINYSVLIPGEDEIKTKVEIEREKLLISVERASLITDETRNALIKMDIDENNLHLAGKSDKGEVSDDIYLEKEGENIKIAFNARYFVEILRNIADEKIIIQFKDNNAPCLITPVDNDSFKYLVMPVRYT